MKRRQMTAADRDVILSRVIGVTDDDASWQKHMSKADVVVEAVFEDLAVKHKVVRPNAVFALCWFGAYVVGVVGVVRSLYPKVVVDVCVCLVDGWWWLVLLAV